MTNVTVLGAGAWGTAFGQVLADAGNNVTMWAIEPEIVEGIRDHHHNGVRLPSVKVLEIADVSSGLVDHGGQHRLGDTLVLPDFLDSLTKDIVIELHRETSLKILATQLYLNRYFIAVRLYKLDLRILYTNLNYSC